MELVFYPLPVKVKCLLLYFFKNGGSIVLFGSYGECDYKKSL